MSRGEQERVLAALSSSVEEIRHQAVRRLPEVFAPVPVDALMRALGDASWRVRKGAQVLLGELDVDEGLVNRLVEALGDGDNAGLRNAASEVLARFGEPVLPHLCGVLTTGNQGERKFAADILGAIASPSAAPALLQALEDEDPNVRAASAEALGCLEPGVVGDALIGALDDPDLLVRLSCLDALVRQGACVPSTRLIPLLALPPLRPAVYRLLAQAPDAGRGREQMLAGLQSRSRRERNAATQALVEHYGKADRRQQVEIRVALTRLSADPDLIDHLRSMLQRGDEAERSAALELLGWTGQEEVVPDLLVAAVDDRSYELVRQALLAIGARAVPGLLDVFDQMGAQRQVLILELLGHFKRPESLSHIVEQCLSSDATVARAAQLALGQFADAGVIPTLVSLLASGTEPVPRGAVESLIRLGERHREQVIEGVEPLLRSDATRLAAAEVLCGVAHKGQMESLTRLLSDGNEQVRAAAVRAVGKIGDDSVIGKLGTALADEQAVVRAEAAAALGLRDSPEAKQALLVALGDEDPWVIREAVASLGRTAGAEVLGRLKELVDHPHGLVAIEAVRALADLDQGRDHELWQRASRHADSEVAKEVLKASSAWPEGARRSVLAGALDDARWDVRMAAVRTLVSLGDAPSLSVLGGRLEREEDPLVKEAIQAALESSR